MLADGTKCLFILLEHMEKAAKTPPRSLASHSGLTASAAEQTDSRRLRLSAEELSESSPALNLFKLAAIFTASAVNQLTLHRVLGLRLSIRGKLYSL